MAVINRKVGEGELMRKEGANFECPQFVHVTRYTIGTRRSRSYESSRWYLQLWLVKVGRRCAHCHVCRYTLHLHTGYLTPQSNTPMLYFMHIHVILITFTRYNFQVKTTTLASFNLSQLSNSSKYYHPLVLLFVTR